MRVDLQPSFVLHVRPYRETSALLEVLGRDSGRLGLVARGARRERSRLRGVLQPFVPLLLSWTARRDLGTLVAAEAPDTAPPLRGDALYAGMYMNELLVRLLHRHDPHPELFEAYAAALRDLAGSGGLEPALRLFEKRLLDAIGYGLVLDHEVESGAPIEAAGRYRYAPERGPCPESDAGNGVPVSGATLIALGRERLDAERELVESKRLMRALLAGLLGPRPLATRSLFRTGARTAPEREL